MSKFYGDLAELKNQVGNTGLAGKWSSDNSTQRFTTPDGAILVWYESTGTLVCQGKGTSKPAIQSLIDQLSGVAVTSVVHSDSPTLESIEPTLFVVYGHDENSREQLELILSKLGVKHFILAKSSGNGLTLIEALEKQVGQDGSAHAGIVLLTPDDFGYAKRDGEGAMQSRARQNVILEMGMLMAKFGRSNTIILVKGDLERPSDTDGIIYHGFKNHVKEILGKVVERLETIGFHIDHKKALNATH